ALAHVINLLDPDAIVLGGGLSNVPIWYERVPQLWSRWVFADRVDTVLLPNRHGDSSGVRGAAWLGRSTPRTDARRRAAPRSSFFQASFRAKPPPTAWPS